MDSVLILSRALLESEERRPQGIMYFSSWQMYIPTRLPVSFAASQRKMFFFFFFLVSERLTLPATDGLYTTILRL